MLKLGFTSPNLATICLHSSTSAKFYLFTGSDKDLFSEVREDMVFTRKANVDETKIRKSTNVSKSNVLIDAGQLYPYSRCQPIPTRLYIRYEFDADLQGFKPRQSKSRNFENMVEPYFQRMTPDCRIESFYTTETQIKNDCFNADGFSGHCNKVFEAMGFFSSLSLSRGITCPN